jgi:hypothetical protein
MASSSRKRKNKTNAGVKSLLVTFNISIGVLAVLWKFFFQNVTSSTSAPSNIQELFDRVCQVTFCSQALSLVGRSIHAKRNIQKGERLLIISESLQISDLDALRDPFVREHLFLAKHKQTNATCGNVAYLAAYLALLKTDTNDNHATDESNTRKSIQRQYMETLPTYQDFLFHPLLWDFDSLGIHLGRHSLAYGIVMTHRIEMESEYQAFTAVSPEFAKRVSEQDYMVSCLSVYSRGYNRRAEESQDQNEELEDYQRLFVELSKTQGVALKPVADMLNHHSYANVEWREAPETGASVLVTTSDILEGMELFASYGERVDQLVFNRYGFNVGDGCSPTLATIATFHQLPHQGMLSVKGIPPTRVNTIQQKQELARYLLYDDGYKECIEPKQLPAAAELKRLKLVFLEQSVHELEGWLVMLEPRNPSPASRESMNIPIAMEPPPSFHSSYLSSPGFAEALKGVLATCRLLSLTHRDFDGRAIELLRSVVEQNKYVSIEKREEALEFRAMNCLARLTRHSLEQQYHRSVSEEMEHVARLNRKDSQNPTLSAAHVRLGEMQTIEAIHQFALGYVEKQFDRLENPPLEDFVVRAEACPSEYSEFLLQED